MPNSSSNLTRILKYLLNRVIILAITLVLGVYISILVANMGGAVDQIRKAQIREGLAVRMMGDQQYKRMSPEERAEYLRKLEELEFKKHGLDKPFLIRSFIYLKQGLTLDFGNAEYITSDSGSRKVKLIILERVGPTLVLMLTTFLINFFTALGLALYLSRRYGTFLDKFLVNLAPLSAAPGWFYGIFLILIFAAVLKWFPFGGMVAVPPPTNKLQYALSLLYHMVLPVTAFLISSLFITAYSWRTYFLIYSSEDYVEMAKAKGLTSKQIEKRYVLKPTMPAIVTSFLLGLITTWTGAIIAETVFNWPGLGQMIFRAINLFDTPVIVGETVIYAYLLAITVLALDIIYAIIDPRVKVGSEGAKQ